VVYCKKKNEKMFLSNLPFSLSNFLNEFLALFCNYRYFGSVYAHMFDSDDVVLVAETEGAICLGYIPRMSYN